MKSSRPWQPIASRICRWRRCTVPKSRDPFVGVNLADQVFPAARDQRLFAPSPQSPVQPPAESPREQEPTNVVSNVPTNQRSKETRTEGNNVPTNERSPS